MVPNKCKHCNYWLLLLLLIKNDLKCNLVQYQLLHLPGLPHLPSNGQWGVLLHRCMLETQLAVVVAHDGLEYAL